MKSHIRETKVEQDFALTDLEAQVLKTIERLGWHAQLWFPGLDRRALNFSFDAPDQEVFAAIVGLIRRGALIHADPEGWRPSNFSPAPDVRQQILPSPGYMRLVHRLPSVPPGPVEKALEAGAGTSESQLDLQATEQHVAKESGDSINLTVLEAQILQSIDHVGWYAHLWFPVVARGALNFGSDEPEENVHMAILDLIRKGALIASRDEQGDITWHTAPSVLAVAEGKVREALRVLNPNPWPDRFSERFHIFAHGETFDLDAFLATSTIRPDYVWRREPRKTSGIEIFLGDGREIRLIDQEEIAIEYLKTHKDELRTLAQFPGVDTFILGLVWICKPEATGFCVGPSPELMRHALDVGILPLYYGTIDEQEPAIPAVSDD